MISLAVNKRNVEEKNKVTRRNGKIPGIVYGGSSNISVTADLIEFKKTIHEAGRSNLVELNIEGKKILSLIKDFQVHPLTDEFIHFDLLEVDKSKEVRISVPIEYQGTPRGVKEGGILEILQDRLEVACKVTSIPAVINIDISNLDSGFSIHLKDIEAPKNTRFTQELSTVLVVVVGDAVTPDPPTEQA